MLGATKVLNREIVDTGKDVIARKEDVVGKLQLYVRALPQQSEDLHKVQLTNASVVGGIEHAEHIESTNERVPKAMKQCMPHET